MYKKIIPFLLVFAIGLSVFTLPVSAAEKITVSSTGSFWQMVANSNSEFMQFLIGSLSNSDLGSGTVCPKSPDAKHYGSPCGARRNSNVIVCRCDYCGETFEVDDSVVADAYADYVDSLPPGLDSSNTGVTKYGSGFQWSTTDGNAAANAFWKTIDLYELFEDSNIGDQLFVAEMNYNSEKFLGFKVYSEADGLRYLLCGNVKSLVPYNSVSFPLGQLCNGVYGSFYRPSDGYYVFLTYEEANTYYISTGKACYFLQPGSYFSIPSKCTGYVGPTFQSVGYISSSGVVSTRGLSPGSKVWHCETVSYSTVLQYGLYPLSTDVSDTDADPGNRVGELTQIINQYNIDNSITNNITNINYYLGIPDENGNISDYYSPGLYNDKTMVFTEPITGAQLQTSGWHYDYDTRSYDIDLVSGTFTAGGVDITGITLTYGDDNVIVKYCDSSGNVVVTDTFAYVLASGSACSLDGHSYTYEISKEPTCAAEGERKYTCSVCGDQYAEAIAKLEHTYTAEWMEQATCISGGKMLYTCTGCGTQYVETLAANEHAYTVSVMKEPTCTSDGVSVYTCAGCGTQYTETVPKLEHIGEIVERVETEYDEDGGVISYGYTVYHCTLCGDEYTVSDAPAVEDESWFSWLGSQFRRLISSIVGGLGDGLEYLLGTVVKPVTKAGLGLIEWLFDLVDLDKLDIWYSWFEDGNVYFDNEFGTEVDVWATG